MRTNIPCVKKSLFCTSFYTTGNATGPNLNAMLEFNFEGVCICTKVIHSVCFLISKVGNVKL
uniref:Uncharacterized protein n=1 Tax=Anguilla anguilla TaxID=7936 RepID=A0A0E9X5R8_ANGAN